MPAGGAAGPDDPIVRPALDGRLTDANGVGEFSGGQETHAKYLHPSERFECFSIPCAVRQTARFKPRGLAGLAYWAAVLPFHSVVFRGMLRGLQREAVAVAR
ncbi:MAG: DUF2867 domain-containing protein [Acidobacteriota bacterium]